MASLYPERAARDHERDIARVPGAELVHASLHIAETAPHQVWGHKPEADLVAHYYKRRILSDAFAKPSRESGYFTLAFKPGRFVVALGFGIGQKEACQPHRQAIQQQQAGGRGDGARQFARTALPGAP